MQTLRDFMRVCSHAKKEAASQGNKEKKHKTWGNKGAEQVPRTIILSFTCCCHSTGQVERAESKEQ